LKNFTNSLKITILALATGFGASSVAMAEKARIGFATGSYPPFSSIDAAGQFVGWEVDFANALCKEAKLDCEVVGVAWEGIIPSLNSKKIDMIIASMSITNERKKVIDFTDKYYNTASAVIGRKEDKFEATPAGLSGKILGVLVSTIHETYANKHFGTAAELKIYQGNDEMYQDLAAGRIDAVQADVIVLDEFLRSAAGACCETKGNVAGDLEILGPGVGIGTRKGETEFRDRLNVAIKRLRDNGTYDAITKKYFAFDIFGN
jgi:polar amino acid transport system substrate-binding protein